MQNSIRDAFMIALKQKGYSLNTSNPEELAEARDMLIQQKPLVQAYVIDQVRDKMINGEAAEGVIYSGEMLYIQEQIEELAGLFRKMQKIKKRLKNGSISYAVLILQRRILTTSPILLQIQAHMSFLMKNYRIMKPCSRIWTLRQ